MYILSLYNCNFNVLFKKYGVCVCGSEGGGGGACDLRQVEFGHKGPKKKGREKNKQDANN